MSTHPPEFQNEGWSQPICSMLQRRFWQKNMHSMDRMWRFSMLGEWGRSLLKIPLIKKECKSFDLNINSYFVKWFYIFLKTKWYHRVKMLRYLCVLLYILFVLLFKSSGPLVTHKRLLMSTKHVLKLSE